MKRCQNTLLAVLVAGIVVQIWIRVGGVSSGEYRPSLTEPLAVGDTVPLLTGYNEAGAPVTVYLNDDGIRGTVLYSFHPACAHSRTWGPEWGRHFDQVRAIDDGVRRIALTSDSPASGQDFAKHFGWEVEFLSLAEPSPRTSDYPHSLVSRTPWVFVFDSNGVLRFDGHGSELQLLEAALATATNESRPP